MKKFKLIFFDCDGVLTPGNTWVYLHKSVGIPEELNYKWRNDYYTGKITWEEWFKKFEKLYLEKKFNRILMKKVLDNIPMNSEAENLVRKLRKIKFQSAIISGSVDYHVRRVGRLLKIDLWRANTNIIFDEKGNFLKFINRANEVDAKELFVKEICSQFGINPTETLFVGDSINDSRAFKLTKHGVLYNHFGRSEDKMLENYAWKKIKNLEEVESLL